MQSVCRTVQITSLDLAAILWSIVWHQGAQLYSEYILNGITEESVEQGHGYLDFAVQEKLHLSHMAPGKRVIDQKMFF